MTTVDPVDALTSGKIAKDDIGKTVYLSNSGTKCQEWRIADVNHDGTEGMVDLISKYVLLSSGRSWGSSSQKPGSYKDSGPFYALQNTVLPYFSKDIKSVMIEFTVDCDGYYNRFRPNELEYQTTETSKIHIPSITELGYSDGRFLDTSYYANYAVKEGTPYPIYDHDSNTNGNALCTCKTSSGGESTYWTRSHLSTNSGNGLFGQYYIKEDGSYSYYKDFIIDSSNFNTIAIIRFGKQ